MITGLNHLTLAVENLDRSLDFYAGLLDCRIEARWDRGAYLSAGELWLCLAVGRVRASNDCTHIAFSVVQDAFDASAMRLVEAGVTLWQKNVSEGESIYFLDPDGHRLELHDGDLQSRLVAVDRMPYSGWRRLSNSIKA